MRKVAALLLLAVLPASAQDAPAAAANTFYSAAIAAHVVGVGIPDTAARVRIAALLSGRLNSALGDAAAAQARFVAKHKTAPPLIEGDIFSSLFEGPTSFSVKACTGDTRAMRCAVALTRQDPGQKPANWIDTLVLVNEAGWKVDDIVYDANFAFGNTGSLSQMLKMTMAEAQ